MKSYVLLAVRMLVSDETICFASGSVHFRALSPVVLARADVFSGAGQGVDCFHNIFTCDRGWESGAWLSPKGHADAVLCKMVPTCVFLFLRCMGLLGSQRAEHSSALLLPHF